jgi:hypothetical protein
MNLDEQLNVKKILFIFAVFSFGFAIGYTSVNFLKQETNTEYAVIDQSKLKNDLKDVFKKNDSAKK